MRRNSVVVCLGIVGFFFLVTSLGIAEPEINKSKQGHDLHLRILASNPRIDKFYRQPFIHGALSNKPVCCISVPVVNWRSLSEPEKQALKNYASSLVNQVKADPFKYSGVAVNAPVAPNVRRNVAAMSNNSWGIIVGKISPDGRDILSDQIISPDR
jgi:hypothetical protein